MEAEKSLREIERQSRCFVGTRKHVERCLQLERDEQAIHRSVKRVAGGQEHSQETDMDTTTLLIILIVLVLLGGGWFGRGRWY
ncbi:hypothetical protein ACHMW7_21735 [Aminobacter sp. UC22_36]|uniref:hypothetical protein n=1 Tax=Aminobacter sp. UC22_36 TaxID=3374549 RepID=UPI00375835A8